MNLYHRTSSMKKLLVFVGVLCMLPIVYAISGRMHPYSASNPITPKRLFMQHIQRTFHKADGSLQKEDAGLWIQPVDYLGFKPLENIPFYKNAEKFQCDGSYCGLPYYYAMRKVIRQPRYLRGDKPEGNRHPLSTKIYKRTQVNTDTIRYSFDITGPDHMNLFLTLKGNATLSDWSMYKTNDGHIHSMSDHNGGDTYIVFYSHGYYSDSWKFWLDFKKTHEGNELAELGIARHYLHGKEARTTLLKSAIKELPPWICENAYVSMYDSFTLN